MDDGGVTDRVKHEIKKHVGGFIGTMIAPDGYYDGYFIDSAYSFFNGTSCVFFIDKCCNWKRSHESKKKT